MPRHDWRKDIKMKIKDGFITRKIGDTNYAVSFDENSPIGNGMIKLSDSAFFIWQLLEAGATEEEVLSAMKERFQAEEDVLRRDISTFVSKLNELGIIE